jgi:hypothetical protein
MNTARAALVAMITCAGVAVPATHANAEEPLLCGLLAPCDGAGADHSDDESEAAPAADGVDADLDLGLDLGLDLDLDLGLDLDVHVVPDSGRLLTVDTDVDHAALAFATVDRTLAVDSQAAGDTDASVGRDGIVVTGNGAADAQAALVAARQPVRVDAANRFCGVQIVIAADSSAACRPKPSAAGATSNARLIAVAESVDLCGAHVVLAGSASTDCGEPSGNGSPAAGSSWTLAGATAAGTLCGASVAVAGESSTRCAGTAQQAPVPGGHEASRVPGTDHEASRTEATGTGTTDASAGAAGSRVAGAQAAQAPNDDGSGDTAGGSGSSLPLTGASVTLLLTLATAVVAAGLVAGWSSRVRVGHQS